MKDLLLNWGGVLTFVAMWGYIFAGMIYYAATGHVSDQKPADYFLPVTALAFCGATTYVSIWAYKDIQNYKRRKSDG